MAVTVGQCLDRAENYLRLADGTASLDNKLAYAVMAKAYQRHARLLIQIADR